MKVGDFIRGWRIKKGLTQEELAKKIDKSRTMLTHYETERAKIPDKVLYKIGEVLNIPDSEISDYIFPFRVADEIDKTKTVTEKLEKKGFLTLFDKNNNVYVYKDGNLLLKTSEHNFLGFYDYGFFKKYPLKVTGFTDENFVHLLNEYGISLKSNDSNKWIYQDWIIGEYELDDEVMFSLLFSALNRVKEELEDYVTFLREKEREEEE